MPQNALTSLSFDWLIDPNATTAKFGPETEYVEWMPYPIPSEIGHGGGEAYNLLTGMTLARGETHFTPEMHGQALTLAEINMAFKEPCFMVQSLIRGQALINDLGNGRQYVYNRGNDVFRFADQLRIVPMHDCSSSVEVISLMIGESILNMLVGEVQSKALLKKLKLLPPPQVWIRPTPAYVSKPLHMALDPALHGSLKTMMAQARTLEYLAALCQSVQEPMRMASTDQDQKLVQRLHDYLIQLEGSLPTLLELASLFGRSAQLLNDDFLAEYGNSIYGFMQEKRMQQAHKAILKTDVPLKQLSERMGYTHVSNFSAAFKRRFGYAPGTLRKQKAV